MLLEYFEENMNYNEFKFCCILFRKHFKGKKCGEVIENCYPRVCGYVIDNTLKIDLSRFRFKTEDTILYFFNNVIKINRPSFFGDQYFKTVEEFLNYFKIPFKDIV